MSSRPCLSCGTPSPGLLGAGLCPACLISPFQTEKQPVTDLTAGVLLDDRYLLSEELGRGGMGIVYRAEQKEPVSRHVAIKVIKPGMDTLEVLKRFEATLQAARKAYQSSLTFAALFPDHPAIPRIQAEGLTALLLANQQLLTATILSHLNRHKEARQKATSARDHFQQLLKDDLNHPPAAEGLTSASEIIDHPRSPF